MAAKKRKAVKRKPREFGTAWALSDDESTAVFLRLHQTRKEAKIWADENLGGWARPVRVSITEIVK